MRKPIQIINELEAVRGGDGFTPEQLEPFTEYLQQLSADEILVLDAYVTSLKAMTQYLMTNITRN
ncbi:hypothetical protein [Bacillus cereus]|uniref:hypothetical protein n=1 Tax=Bacillus cereus TaxID=1396 RepID=UPI001C8B836F|nr:hypothetical protein [Bacillus cereus]MBX9158742.1 hypothetical protein [Bacillus cereus]